MKNMAPPVSIEVTAGSLNMYGWYLVCFIRMQFADKKINKAVLEPRVSPDFAITYFCNHCNIRFENTDQSMWIH